MFYRLTGSAKQWPVLAMISTAQLMVVLDISIVNVALPSMQSDLGFTNASREWVVTSYALAFGSLLLLGGRLTDLFGPKRSLLARSEERRAGRARPAENAREGRGGRTEQEGAPHTTNV